MSVAEMTPAPGQGCLAVQARADDRPTIDALAGLDDSPSRDALVAERALMRAFGGGCALPLGALAERVSDGMRMVAIVLTPDGGRYARTEVQAATPEEVAELARLDLAASGGDEILALAR
jgi:hydroxymethylbilane synthase